MEKQQIIQLLEEKHQELFEWLKNHPSEKWEKGPEGKWTTGQHVLHLIQSEKALNKVMALPKFFLKYKFGTCNRDQRNYEEVVNKYEEKLKGILPNTTVSFSANMSVPAIKEKQSLLNLLEKENKKMQKKVGRWSEKDLEKYIVPHPLMGRMPFKEITMWTAHHTFHHLNTLKNNY